MRPHFISFAFFFFLPLCSTASHLETAVPSPRSLVCWPAPSGGQVGATAAPQRVRVLDLPFTCVEWVLPSDAAHAPDTPSKWAKWSLPAPPAPRAPSAPKVRPPPATPITMRHATSDSSARVRLAWRACLSGSISSHLMFSGVDGCLACSPERPTCRERMRRAPTRSIRRSAWRLLSRTAALACWR